MSAPGDGKTAWWVAGLLAAILLAGAPSYVTLLTNVPNRSEFQEVQRQLVSIQERQASLLEKTNSLVDRVVVQQEQINALLASRRYNQP